MSAFNELGARVTAPTVTEYGRLLREFRERRRMTQGRLAQAAGYDATYVSRLESGQREPSREAVERLADVLCLSAGERSALLVASVGVDRGDLKSAYFEWPTA
jgi:transcriptional regulator with XRE-family HTH domain